VKNGLPETVQKSLDVVRVTGNNAVHPGQMDAADVNAAASLFALVNVIVEYMHAQDDRWRQIAKTDHVTWYADMTRRSTETVTTLNPNALEKPLEKVTARVVWVKKVYAKPQTGAGGKEYDTVVLQYFVDCKKHRWARGQWLARGSDGSVVESGDDSQIPVPFTEVVPETVGEEAMNAMCKL
jgi:Surface-adhesin protein E